MRTVLLIESGRLTRLKGVEDPSLTHLIHVGPHADRPIGLRQNPLI